MINKLFIVTALQKKDQSYIELWYWYYDKFDGILYYVNVAYENIQF